MQGNSKIQNDHTLLLSIFSPLYRIFNNNSDYKLTIPHTVLFTQNKKMWYWGFSQNRKIRSLKDTLLKMKLFYSYFCVEGLRQASY
jgi:hypothetical protein